MTGAQNRLIHELVEQSRDRVAHVRAGQSLLHVLDSQSAPPPPAELADLLRRHPVQQQHTNQQHQPAKLHASDAGGLRVTLRKRAAIAIPTAPHSVSVAPSSHQQQPLLPSSYEQFAFYAGSKLRQSESLNMLDRRKALPLSASTTQLAQLAHAAAKATQKDKNKNKKNTATEEPPAAANHLLRAVAVLKSQHAFKANMRASKSRARLALPRELLPGVVKNAHVAFQEFRKATQEDNTSSNSWLGPRGAAATAMMNATTHEPLRFGDTVTLLSLVADLPLAIGRNGRTMTVQDAVLGPHMALTIVDFCDPSRRDDVLLEEPFWLRVESAALSEMVQEEDEIVALLVDTQYYLGGPGWREEHDVDKETENVVPGSLLPAAMSPHKSTGATAATAVVSSTANDRLFKVVAMRARVPSAEYYGDDRATREYACETNPSIVRLARWRFVSTASNTTTNSTTTSSSTTTTSLVLNGASVGLMQADFALEYDGSRRRGVLRGSIEPMGKDTRQRESRAWQVRLLQRGTEPATETRTNNTTSTTNSNTSPTAGRRRRHQPTAQQHPTEKESLEWQQHHESRIATQEKRIQSKRRLAKDARSAYDKVAAQSNSKLAQIEKYKALHHREYFQSRLQQQQKQQRLHGAVSLPHL